MSEHLPVILDMAWSVEDIEACLDRMEDLHAQAQACTHRSTIALARGRYCVDCHAVLALRLEYQGRWT